MPRFDIYVMPGKDRRGYVLDVQANLLDDLKSRVVVPLLPQTGSVVPAQDLNHVFLVDGEPHLMLKQAIATVPAKELGRVVASLSAEEQDAAARALDVLFMGV